MTAAMKAAARTHERFQAGVCTRAEINERLGHWWELLRQHDEGRTNSRLSRADILSQLDRWLDESNDLRGR